MFRGPIKADRPSLFSPLASFSLFSGRTTLPTLAPPPRTGSSRTPLTPLYFADGSVGGPSIHFVEIPDDAAWEDNFEPRSGPHRGPCQPRRGPARKSTIDGQTRRNTNDYVLLFHHPPFPLLSPRRPCGGRANAMCNAQCTMQNAQCSMRGGADGAARRKDETTKGRAPAAFGERGRPVVLSSRGRKRG